jgi:hypothetical protein
MGALLALVPSRDWFYGALIVALGALLIYERHVGEVHELAAIQASSAKLVAQTAVQTAELKAKATMAEQAYDKEANSLANVAAQPAPVVRLCQYGSHPIVPATGGAQPGNATPGAAAPSVQQVPPGNPSSAGPDIGGMLVALGEAADRISAELREYQARGQ